MAELNVTFLYHANNSEQPATLSETITSGKTICELISIGLMPEPKTNEYSL